MDSPSTPALPRRRCRRRIAGAIDGLGLAWIGPPISDQKAATALDFVADYLFREQTGVVVKALDAKPSDALVVGQFITLHDPGIMVVTIGGSHEKDTEKQRSRRAREPAAAAGRASVQRRARSVSFITSPPIRKLRKNKPIIWAGMRSKAT